MADFYWGISPDFRFPRSYLQSISLNWVACDILQATNPIILQLKSDPKYRLYCKIQDRAWAWSSNTYSVGWMIEDLYVLDPSPGTGRYYAGTFSINFGHSAYNRKVAMYISSWFIPNQINFMDMPGAPAGYWLPPLPV